MKEVRTAKDAVERMRHRLNTLESRKDREDAWSPRDEAERRELLYRLAKAGPK